ncbi:hypothetical protein AAW30_01826 [Arcobacter porcinus]|uniref:hypothetical protein n=1 Tax=Arcobacter porcinus TaxID=1935204 RepID=UPI0008259CB2|nr:hypothetical protein [Arcobacter porcinus]OCL81610.1 hypothetical protein AAW30_01826 [Arcobacter porcinus]
MFDTIATTFITGAFTLGGVYLGTLLNSLNESKKSSKEIKIRAFTKLASLKLPLIQSIQTNIEAQLLCEYYEARAYMLNSNADLEEAKVQNNRMLALIPEVTKQRSEFAMAVAEIRIAFKIPKEINHLLMDIYKAQSLKINSVVNLFNNEEELNQWKNVTSEQIINHLKNEYTNKIEKIIEHLYPEFEKL